MKLVFVCSPYRGDVKQNIANAIEYCRREISNGNTPIAPHLIYPQMIADDDKGIKLGLNILDRCDELHVYGEPSEGMQREISYAHGKGIAVVYK